MGFKDPYNVEYSSVRDIKNTVELDAKYTNLKSETKPVKAKATFNHYFKPLDEKITMSKSTGNNKTGLVGERINFRINVNFRYISKNRYMHEPTMIDLLPKGLTADEKTKVSGIYATGKYIKNWEIIENFNNTGQDAIKIVFESDYAANLKGGDATHINVFEFSISNLLINEDIIPTKGETESLNNDNQVYFFYGHEGQDFLDGIKSDSKVQDIYDVNMNGLTSDSVLKATSKVLGVKADSIQSVKGIRSLEPIEEGGPLDYSRIFTDEITNRYNKDKVDTDGAFQYDLSIRNFYNKDLEKVAIYDVFPSKEDGRGSVFSNTLQGPAKAYIKGEDVTEQFEIYYRTDLNPTRKPEEEIDSDKWTQEISDYSQVTAIKVLSKDGTVLKPYEVLSIILDMRTPSYDPEVDLNDKLAVNDFDVRYGNSQGFGRANSVKNSMPPKTKVDVKKVWDDANNQDGVRPNEVTVKLYADGEDTGKTLILNETNQWSGRFVNLNKYKDGVLINYTIKEDVVTVPEGRVGYTSEITGSVEKGFVVTNTRTPEKLNLGGQKTWDDGDNQDGKRPESITIQLMKRVKGTLEEFVEVVGKIITVTKENGWKWIFNDLPKYESGKELEYIVIENKVDGYKDPEYSGSMEDGFEVKNSRIPEKTSVAVKKVWEDANNQDGLRPAFITIKLLANGVDTGKTLSLNEASQWQGEFTGLDKYKEDKEIEYTVAEDQVTGYEAPLYSGDMNSGLRVTNSRAPETIEVSGKKTWDDANNQDGKRPDSIKIRLLADGREIASKEVRETDKWSWTFTNLQKNKGKDRP